MNNDDEKKSPQIDSNPYVRFFEDRPKADLEKANIDDPKKLISKNIPRHHSQVLESGYYHLLMQSFEWKHDSSYNNEYLVINFKVKNRTNEISDFFHLAHPKFEEMDKAMFKFASLLNAGKIDYLNDPLTPSAEYHDYGFNKFIKQLKNKEILAELRIGPSARYGEANYIALYSCIEALDEAPVKRTFTSKDDYYSEEF